MAVPVMYTCCVRKKYWYKDAIKAFGMVMEQF